MGFFKTLLERITGNPFFRVFEAERARPPDYFEEQSGACVGGIHFRGRLSACSMSLIR
jgi:hypothetical protein